MRVGARSHLAASVQGETSRQADEDVDHMIGEEYRWGPMHDDTPMGASVSGVMALAVAGGPIDATRADAPDAYDAQTTVAQPPPKRTRTDPAAMGAPPASQGSSTPQRTPRMRLTPSAAAQVRPMRPDAPPATNESGTDLGWERCARADSATRILLH